MYNIYSGDPVRAHEAHEISLYKYEQLRPVCKCCGEHITDKIGFYLNDEWFCKSCVEESETNFNDFI